jgi:hypothetical protein
MSDKKTETDSKSGRPDDLAKLSLAGSAVGGSRIIPCSRYEAAVNARLDELDSEMKNSLSPCDEKRGRCSCSGEGGGKKIVDLVVLIDSSGSMTSAARAVSDAASAAVAAAARECPSDLRVTWLTVDSEKPGADPAGDIGDITAALAGTPFKQTHQQYLEGIGKAGPFKQDESQPAGDITYLGEEGGDSIADLCNFYDWRPGACRSIFYISDTALDGYSAFYDAAATNATATALANGVVLFAHKIPELPDDAAKEAAYDHMTDPTGGSTYHGPVDSAKYVELVKNAICRACGTECKEAKLPEISPCITVKWGNSECDCFETDDTEIVYISVCNCYSNITLSNLHISYLEIVNEDGSAVPSLPDGTPSVQIVPIGPICFGDIGPCVEEGDNCVTRQLVVRTRGAKGGRYRLVIRGICYEVRIAQNQNDCFVLDLCQD